MVQLERQRHAEPHDTRRHADDLAGRGRLRPRVIETHRRSVPSRPGVLGYGPGKTRAPQAIAWLLLWALAGCATAARPTIAPAEQWRRDLDAFALQREALAAAEDFAGLDDKLATLAARVGRGEEPDDSQTLVRGLWSLTLGELALFQRYLALSSRAVELEAAHAEAESARLELLLRRLRLTLAGAAPPGDSALATEPLRPPFDCPRRRVGPIEFVSCR